MSKRHRIIGIGEVLWDVFPDGPRFGGAPANFACHAAALGAEVAMVSCVGDDPLGEQAIEALRERGVDTSYVSRTGGLPTGTVQVVLDERRSPTYVIAAPVAWDAIEWSSGLEGLAARADAVCFGTLAQRSERSRETIQRFVQATPREALRVLDVNLRQSFHSPELIRTSLAAANVLKLNEDELPVVAEACGIEGSTDERLQGLCNRFTLRLVAMTRGANGALVASRDGTSDCPGFAANVRDTVGAGDSYTAALVVGVLRGESLDHVNRHACRVAAYVCSQSGATPPLPAELV
jgi:fructokinase